MNHRTTPKGFAKSAVSVACSLLFSAAFADEPPAVSRISPPGGARGAIVSATLVGKTGDGALTIWSDLGQLKLDVNEKLPAIFMDVPDDATPGIHWVRFYNQFGTSELMPFVVGVVPEIVETEPNNLPKTANSIELPSVTINGVLAKSADVDTYSVSLKEKQTLVASVLANRELGSPMDAVLQVLNSNGVVMTQIDDDHALDPQIAFTAPENGQYFVRLFAFPAAPNSTIRLASGANYVYRLTVTTEGFVDFAIPAAVDGSAETDVTIHGWNLPGNQRQVSVSPQRPESFLITDQLAQPLRIPRSTVRTFAERLQDRQLAFPCSVSGIITDDKQVDAFAFEGHKGQKVSIVVDARQMFSQLDPVLRLRKESGVVLKEADDISRQNLDCKLNATLPADGRYTLEVTDRYDSGSSRHFYVVHCEETLPSVTATVSSTSFTIDSDKPVEIPVTINRVDGFDQQIEFAIHGLPEGISAKATQSESKGDSAKKITLKMSRGEGTASFSGLISIVGRSKDSSVQATAKIPNSTELIDSFWLTVLPAVAKQPAAEASSKQ